MSKRLKDDTVIGTPDSIRTAFHVLAATKLTASYAKDASATDRDVRFSSGWIDTRVDLGDHAGAHLFDQYKLVCIPAIGSALKIRMRIALSNDAGTNEEYMRVGGEVWEKDFGAEHSGVRIDLPAFTSHHRYFAIEAKYIGGSDTGTGLYVGYRLLHSNTGDGGVHMTVHDPSRLVEEIRTYAALPASGGWTDPIEVDVLKARFLDLLAYYVEGSGSSGGKAEIEVELLRTHGSQYYGVPTCPVKRSVFPADGTYVTTQVRPESYELEGENVEKNLSAGSWSGGTATITLGASHGVREGDYITVRNTTPSGYDVDMALVTAVTSTTVSYAVSSDPGAWSSGGTCWLVQPFRMEFDAINRYDAVRIRAKETGDTGNQGDLFLLLTRFLA